MDEKQLEQLSSSSGIPLELLSRSIQARAESSGVTPVDILNSWSGGEAIDPLPVSNEEVDVVEEAANEAIINGADILVIGRPITESADPAKAAEEFLNEIQ